MLTDKPGPVSERKLRLFAIACCQRIRHLFTDPLLPGALQASEEFADGLLPSVERARFARQVRESHRPNGQSTSARSAREAVWFACRSGSMLVALNTARHAVRAVEEAARERMATMAHRSSAHRSPIVPREISEREQAAQADLLRELVGNPFRLPRLDPDWLAWEAGTLRRLAWDLYEDRAYEQLPILADALEEAGCTDQALLDHCRSPDGHCKGCWALDLLLDRA
jgi:hypothetical protein